MRGGFTFKDVDIADIGIEYAPEMGDTFVYRPSQVNIHEETFDGHDGGYFYGSTIQPKEFTLRCFFEQKEIDRGIMEKVYHLFRKGTSGKLVFQRRPWCYYYATVINVDDSELRNYLNGLIKVTMKAYYPFARSDDVIYPSNRLDYFKVMSSTAFLDKPNMMPPACLNLEQPLEEETSILLYNAGNEYAGVGIEIAGDGAEGVEIINETTNQKCIFQAFTKAKTTDLNKYIYYDSINGKPLLITEDDGEITDKEIKALYHSSGRLDLAPGYPILREMYIRLANSNSIVFANMLFDNETGETLEYANMRYKGRFVYVSGAWREIKQVTDVHTVLLEDKVWTVSEVENASVQKTVIANMNKITIKPVIGMSLTRLKFNYKHTFA